MLRYGTAITAWLLLGLATACSGDLKPADESEKSEISAPAEVAPEIEKKKEQVMPIDVPKAEISGKLVEPSIPETVKDVKDNCAGLLAEAKVLRDKLVEVEGQRTIDNTLAAMNDIDITIDAVLPFSELMANVHPDKKVRTAAEKCQQDAMKFVTDLGLDREVYDALNGIETDKMGPMAKRSLDHHLRDYRRSGVDKDEKTRKRLAEINEELVKKGQEFSRRIREDKRSIEVAPEDLEGLPEDFIKSHAPGKNGKVKLTTDYPDFFPVQNYLENSEVRKALYKEFLSRAYPENEATFKRILELRHEYAVTLGYPNWAQYNAEDKMAKNQKTIGEFIDKVSSITRPRMKKDLEEILGRKKADNPDAQSVRTWDRFYYVKKIQAEKYGVDSQEVRKYFDYEKVRDGILSVYQNLFGVEFRPVVDGKVWHEDVVVYDVLSDGKPAGRFYLDMHPRDGKYGHAAMFNVFSGITDRQLPVASLVCNFPKPPEDGPALMEHGDVTTFFHEFGHLLHHLLGGGYKWANLSGIACEWDFVEAPSQLLEEWSWDHDVLARFAVHHETGKVIPKDLVEKMRAADEFGKGVHVMRQMFYAALSFNYHVVDPAQLDLVAKMKEIQSKYNPYPYEEGTHVFANFGHLEGYSSMYYTYMWSLNISKDLFTRFEKEGLMDKKVAADYRKYVVGAGGAVDAEKMVTNFLGRESSFDAFESYLKK